MDERDYLWTEVNMNYINELVEETDINQKETTVGRVE